MNTQTELDMNTQIELDMNTQTELDMNIQTELDMNTQIELDMTEPPLDRHMPVFSGKYFPCTGKKLSRRYHVPAENQSDLCDFLSQKDILLPMR